MENFTGAKLYNFVSKKENCSNPKYKDANIYIKLLKIKKKNMINNVIVPVKMVLLVILDLKVEK